MLSLAMWSIISFVKHRPDVIFSLGLRSASTALLNCVDKEDKQLESLRFDGITLMYIVNKCCIVHALTMQTRFLNYNYQTRRLLETKSTKEITGHF